MITTHSIYFGNARNMKELASESVNLVVTSPPYPMIEMWDAQFGASSSGIRRALEAGDGKSAYELMHRALDKVWQETDRVLAPSGIVCINIGDATRKVGEAFRLYPNHVRITSFFVKAGYDVLPMIIWRKTSNKPNKFMGSGMLPPNAYVTLEHEYVLIFRKGGNRQFGEGTAARRQSAYFREERNAWFSDVWSGLKGVPQQLKGNSRNRSAAYPFELPYRLIQMYSVQGDTVLDPFAGTGTTLLAAMASARNSAGYELDRTLEPIIDERVAGVKKLTETVVAERLEKHRQLTGIARDGGSAAYLSKQYSFSVTTSQETDIRLTLADSVEKRAVGQYRVKHSFKG
ncbi:DNA-methyltransferase [Methanocella sp. MCL-LM]|uniref:DNA-methyltransferase n=1 Tax=Methanocella sp. MCL-LM TaxID=3412035 RepID=UPI003C782736